MLKETEMEETIVFFVTFLRYVLIALRLWLCATHTGSCSDVQLYGIFVP